MTTSPAALLGRALRALAALAALVLIVVGVPLALAHYVGWPLPRAVPSLDEVLRGLTEPGLPEGLVIKILAVICWLAWAQFTAGLMVEITAALRGQRAPLLPLGGTVQAMAGWLLGALLLSVVPLSQRGAGSPLALAASAGGGIAEPATLTAPLRPGLVADGARPAAHREREAVQPKHPVYLVKRYDTLWGIAERCLDDGLRWPEIFRLNKDREQPGGERLTDPDLIRPGWRLRLPAGATLPGETATPPARPSRPAEPAPAPSGPPATAPPAPSSTTAVTAPPSAPVATASTTEEDTGRPPGGISIELPSGSVVSTAFAAGMLSALALIRIRDRRRRQPQPPEPGIRDHDPGVPDTLRWLMRLAEPETGPTEPSLALSAARGPAATTPSAADLAVVAGQGPLIGERAGQPLHLDVATLGAVSLLGSGAEGFARAIVATMLATAGTERAEVHLATGRVLAGLPPLPGLHRPASLEEALLRLEAELVRRTRLLDQAGTADLAGYRRHTDLEPLSDSLLITDRDGIAHHAERLLALVEQGRRLGIAALVLTDDPLPATAVIEVETGGQFATAAPTALRTAIDGARLHTLTERDAAMLLGILAQARAGDPAAFPGNTEPTGQPSATPTASLLDEAPVRPFDPPASSNPAPRRLRVQLLGVFRIHAGEGELGRGLLKKARELLAFYALHPEGVPLDVAAEALWPGADPDRSPQRFWSTLTNLRRLTRDALALAETKQFDLIAKVGDRYQLDPDAVDIDLWRFQAALGEAAQARKAGDAMTELDALARAADAYNGPLLAGAYYEWRVDGQRDVEAEREDLRRRAADALTRLAELHEAAGDQAASAAALERAIDLDPAGEELYRRLMRLQDRMGRRDAVRHTFQRLEASLTDLGVEPEDATERVLRETLGL